MGFIRFGFYTPRFNKLRLLPLIAQRPVMARWNRDAESIYKLKEPIRTYDTEKSEAI